MIGEFVCDKRHITSRIILKYLYAKILNKNFQKYICLQDVYFLVIFWLHNINYQHIYLLKICRTDFKFKITDNVLICKICQLTYQYKYLSIFLVTCKDIFHIRTLYISIQALRSQFLGKIFCYQVLYKYLHKNVHSDTYEFQRTLSEFFFSIGPRQHRTLNQLVYDPSKVRPTQKSSLHRRKYFSYPSFSS